MSQSYCALEGDSSKHSGPEDLLERRRSTHPGSVAHRVDSEQKQTPATGSEACTDQCDQPPRRTLLPDEGVYREREPRKDEAPCEHRVTDECELAKRPEEHGWQEARDETNRNEQDRRSENPHHSWSTWNQTALAAMKKKKVSL
jgi:hypothetical protein